MNMKYAARSEDTEQITVMQWAQYNESRYPELKWLHHCPNGGSRNRLEAVKLKQMGVKAGVADICLPYPRGIYCGLYIEMKYGTNKQQETQKEFLKDMAAAGHFVVTCYSAQLAIDVITQYLNLPDMAQEKEYKKTCEAAGTECDIFLRRMRIPNNSILKEGKTGKGGA